MPDEKRKTGKRKEDLSSETLEEVVKKAKPLIRLDVGGKDVDEQIRAQAADQGLRLSPAEREFVRKFAQDQLESSRRRVFPRLNEAIRRAKSCP